MTDINNWDSLIRRETTPSTPERGSFSKGHVEYLVVPLNEYQMGNILGLLKRSKDKNTGDWWYELVDIIFVAMGKLGIKELVSNWGDKFTRDSINSGAWLKD